MPRLLLLKHLHHSALFFSIVRLFSDLHKLTRRQTDVEAIEPLFSEPFTPPLLPIGRFLPAFPSRHHTSRSIHPCLISVQHLFFNFFSFLSCRLSIEDATHCFHEHVRLPDFPLVCFFLGVLPFLTRCVFYCIVYSSSNIDFFPLIFPFSFIFCCRDPICRILANALPFLVQLTICVSRQFVWSSLLSIGIFFFVVSFSHYTPFSVAQNSR